MLSNYKTAKKRRFSEAASTHLFVEVAADPKDSFCVCDRTLFCCGQLREQEVQYFFSYLLGLTFEMEDSKSKNF